MFFHIFAVKISVPFFETKKTNLLVIMKKTFGKEFLCPEKEKTFTSERTVDGKPVTERESEVTAPPNTGRATEKPIGKHGKK